MSLYWKSDKTKALILGFLALGSYAFMDRVIQVQPQALDFVLLPLALSSNGLLFVVASVLMFWNHGYYGLFAVGGLLLYHLIRKDWKLPVSYLLLIFPMLLLLLEYSSGIFRFTGGFENIQESQFWSNPLIFTVLYQRFLVFGYGVAAYSWILEICEETIVFRVRSEVSVDAWLFASVVDSECGSFRAV